MKLSAVSFIVGVSLSIAFQLTLAIFPKQLEPYAGAVKYIWIFSLGAGVSWLGVWLASKKDGSPVTPSAIPPAPQPITFAPVITQTASPVIVQSPAAPAPRQRMVVQHGPRPDIIFVNTLEMSLLEQMYVFRDARAAGLPGNRAIVAAIANRVSPGQNEVAAAFQVRAHIIFRRGDHEVYSGFGAWVDCFSQRADFVQGGLQKLIIVSENGPMPGLVFGVTNPRDYSLPTRRVRALQHRLENSRRNNMTVLTDNSLDIEITLYEGSSVRATFSLKYERVEDGTYKITRVS